MKTYTYTKTLTAGEFSAQISVTLQPTGEITAQTGSHTVHPRTAVELTCALAEMEASEQARIDRLNDARHETLGALAALGYTLACTETA